MMNLKKVLSYTLYLVLATVLFTSCTGVETPNIDCNDRPFVVGMIEQEDGVYKYTAKDYTLKFTEMVSGKQAVYSKEKFEIGDTLRLTK